MLLWKVNGWLIVYQMIRKTLVEIYLKRHILWRMAAAQLKAKYSGSILGIAWAVLNPVLIMFAVAFVFSAIIKIEIKNFPLFALSGIFPWMFFSNAIFDAAFSILNQQGILRQFNLPREFIPLSSVLANFLNFLIGWSVIYPIFFLFKPQIFLLFPVLVLIITLTFLFVCGLGLIAAVVNIFFKDFGHLLNVLLMLWFWVTPVFYSLDMVPEGFKWVFNLNPMAYYIACYRDIVFRGNMPGVFVFFGAAAWCLLSVTIGITVFAYSKNKFLKKI